MRRKRPSASSGTFAPVAVTPQIRAAIGPACTFNSLFTRVISAVTLLPSISAEAPPTGVSGTVISDKTGSGRTRVVDVDDVVDELGDEFERKVPDPASVVVVDDRISLIPRGAVVSVAMVETGELDTVVTGVEVFDGEVVFVGAETLDGKVVLVGVELGVEGTCSIVTVEELSALIGPVFRA